MSMRVFQSQIGYRRKHPKLPIKIKIKEHAAYLAIENPADIAIEAIRSLRTSLHFAMMEAKNNVIMIPEPAQMQGRRLLVVILVAVIAQTGKKVLFD